ncbi:MAG: hypothetical protein ACLU4J_18980 [Butyricimonas paravirosa]
MKEGGDYNFLAADAYILKSSLTVSMNLFIGVQVTRIPLTRLPFRLR